MKPALAALVLTLLSACTKATVYDHGVPNLSLVAPGLYRSGEPSTPEAWAYVKSLGVKQVVKLNFEREGSDDGARQAGLEVLYVPIQPEGDKDVFDNLKNTFVKPSETDLRTALYYLESGTLVHCTHGQDRTGLVVGLYRLKHGASKEAAYKEMLEHGFHPELHGLHEYWEHAR